LQCREERRFTLVAATLHRGNVTTMSNDFNNLLEADLASRALSVGQVVEGTVVQISEDGVFIDIGTKSEGHLELDQIVQEELAKLNVGDRITVRIIKSEAGEFKLSKKSVDFENAWNKISEDKEADREVDITIVEKVKNGYMAEAYGILQGFIHHTNFRGRPGNGQVFPAKVLDCNRKARKLVFTRRDIIDREEKEALERDFGMLQEGMVVEGVVDKLSPYGAFIKITDALTGLLHISEFSYDHIKKPTEVLKPGDLTQVKILAIDRDKKKISLSRKATMLDPLETLFAGEELDGSVESVAEFGVFVRMSNGVTGLVHVSELSHKRCNHPSELFKPGDAIRVKVLRVQPEERRVSLSAKACERDPWTEVYSRYQVGQRVTGPVTQAMQSGLVMKIDDFFEAFVPVSEISEERIKHPRDVHEEGTEVSGVVLSIDGGKRRIRVSLRRTEENVHEEVQSSSYGGRQPAFESDIQTTAGKVTLGDIFAGKLDLTKGTKETKEKESAPAAEATTEVAAPAEVVAESVENTDEQSESSCLLYTSDAAAEEV
jgi:small subunit ribosomal protein S1